MAVLLINSIIKGGARVGNSFNYISGLPRKGSCPRITREFMKA